MPINRSACITLALVCSVSLLSASANATPPEAMNKTVTVSFNYFIPARCENGSDNQVGRSVTHQIYISTKGRLFAKMSASAGGGRHTYSREGLAEPSLSNPFHFSGNKLIGTFVTVSGASQQIISFDPSYRSCTLQVITGREGSKPYVWTNLAGAKCTGMGRAQVSNISCSVTEGNSFAR